jgi:Glycolipid transfer protein (GLTP)
MIFPRRASLKEGILLSRTCRWARGERVSDADSSRHLGPSDPIESRTWAVGRLSMMLLLFVTFSDMALTVVNKQIHTIDAHDEYDALSADVIRPAFRYTIRAPTIDRPNIGLGSAAISSITDALGPILPFTGGIDLRRSEYYNFSGNFLENLSALVRMAVDAYENAEDVEETPSGKQPIAKPSSNKTEKRKHHSILGASHSFVPLKDIAELTLKDMGTVFHYAISSTHEGFHTGKFLNSVLPRVKTVIESMNVAVSQSRGRMVKVAKMAPLDSQAGQMDAFMFCAVMRIFGEWRILRQVPEGYKGYAVGMSLGQKDIVQNIIKIERAAQAWINDHAEEGLEVRSPTLRDVLRYEILLNAHPNLPRLTEAGGAMGLLWVRRQLQYQTAIFHNILEVPSKYNAAKDAVSAAYTEVYDNYHGFWVQKIFIYSFEASPKVEEIFKFMNPHRLKEVREEARHMQPASVLCEEGPEQDVLMKDEETAFAYPPSNPFHRMGWEFEKLVHNIGKHFDGDRKVQGGSDTSKGLSGDELEDYIVAEMSKDVRENIVSYLTVVKPLLSDIAGLYEELNMDDPTKV